MKKRHTNKTRPIFLEPYHYVKAGRLSAKSTGKPHSIEEYFTDYFGRKAILTPNGRTAISLILKKLNLAPDDEIYVTTTFEKPNVSACVTSTIFNFCKPSRVFTGKTKAIFIIHEFGVPHPKTEELAVLSKKRRIPLIEDCAHTIDSRYKGKMVGSAGDYAICSFPKIFPIKYGGLLIGDDVVYEPTPTQNNIIKEVRTVLPRYMHLIREYSTKKRANFRILAVKFKKIDLKPLQNVNEDISPSLFFPLVTDKFEEVIEKSRRSGIECGLWHGTNIVVLPAHQFLVEKDLGHIFNVVKSVYD